jgi:hypothetical protein
VHLSADFPLQIGPHFLTSAKVLLPPLMLAKRLPQGAGVRYTRHSPTAESGF